MYYSFIPGCSVVRQQLHETTDVALMDKAAPARARVALALGVFVAEVMAATRRIALEAIRRFAKTLGRSLVGFQLRHETISTFFS
jgi:hypothetical protein